MQNRHGHSDHLLKILVTLGCVVPCFALAACSIVSGSATPPEAYANMPPAELMAVLEKRVPLGTLMNTALRAIKNLDTAYPCGEVWLKNTGNGTVVAFPQSTGYARFDDWVVIPTPGSAYAQIDHATLHYSLRDWIYVPYASSISADFSCRLLTFRFDQDAKLRAIDVGPNMGMYSGTMYAEAFSIGESK